MAGNMLHTVSTALLRALACALAGFALRAEHAFLPQQYFLVFAPFRH